MTDRLDQSLGKAQRIEALIIYEASGQAASQKLDIHFGGGRKTHTQARGGNQEFRVMDPEGLVEGLTHSPNQADLDGQRLSD